LFIDRKLTRMDKLAYAATDNTDSPGPERGFCRGAPGEREAIRIVVKLDMEGRQVSDIGRATAEHGVKRGDEPTHDSNDSPDFIQVVGIGEPAVESADVALAVLIREQLECHPHFRGQALLVQIELVEDAVVLSGCLPTHYLKQLLQEATGQMPGVADIDNRVVVTRPNQ
jgi:hypothetical protein